ncbi:MAG: SPOR domain-containing protein [Micrococcales bacterium]
MTDDKVEYWFNMKTKTVEVGKQSAALYRVGPFETEAEAKAAESLLAERAQAWLDADQAED